MKSASFIPYEMKTSIVNITSYENRNLVGRLQNPYFKEDMHFKSTTELIFLIEDMLNNLNFPQPSMESRKFKKVFPKNEKTSETSPPEEADILASFKINVFFRQNVSWQGNLVWLERQEEAQFRSVLEMLMLIDSVITP